MGGLLLGRHVAGGGEHAEHVAARVFVDRCIVKNVGEAPILVANGQRVVGDESLGEDLLVSLPSLAWLGEVVGEIRPDQLLPRNPGYLVGTLVDIGDLAFGADGYQRVEAGLDQAAGIHRGLQSLLLDTLALGDIASNGGNADQVAGSVKHRRNRERYGDRLAILSNADGFVVLDAFAISHSLEDHLGIVGAIGMNQKLDGLADDLFRLVTVDRLSPTIPAGDRPVQ